MKSYRKRKSLNIECKKDDILDCPEERYRPDNEQTQTKILKVRCPKNREL